MYKVASGDEQRILPATRRLREVLSVSGNPHIGPIVGTGVVPRFVGLLAYDHNCTLQVSQ